MFQGLSTVVYKVNNLDQAKRWYSQGLGIEPYFDEPFYVGFNVGGFELGLDPDMTGVSGNNGSAVAYWRVNQLEPVFNRLLAMGAVVHTEIQTVGGDIRVAAVTDPFGNIVGLIENPHFALENAG